MPVRHYPTKPSYPAGPPARFKCSVVALAIATTLAPAFGQTPATEIYPAMPGTISSGTGNQAWANELSVRTQATVTNNSNYGNFSGDKEGDVVFEVAPAWRFNRQGERLKVDGAVSLDMLAYVNGSQTSRILPRADVLAKLEAIDNFFFIDGALNVSQQVENVFLPTSSWASTNNLYTSSQVRVAPYFQGEIGQNIRWLVRSDNSYTWTSQSDTSLSNVYYQRNLAQVVRSPTPLGLTLQVVNDLTRYQGQLQPDQTLNTARAILDYAVTPQLKVGLRGGYESTTYNLTETSGPIYGANGTWRPSPLTSLDGFWEQRFYGPSYEYRFTHRQRRVASTISGYRTVTTYPQVLFQIPSTNSLSGLLDSILVARFPDPIDRAQQVQELVTRQGLPQSLPQGAFIYNQSPNVLTGANANWALIGARNTLGLNLFYLKTENLPDPRIPSTFLVFNNSIQQGGGVTLSHRLTPSATLNATITTSGSKGFDANEGLNTRQSSASVQWSWQASPRTNFFAGVRYQVQNDNGAVASRTADNEAAIFAGLSRRL